MSDDLLTWLADNGYQSLRTLEDGTIVGTLELVFTRSVVIGLDRWGWERRYCYEDRPLATLACAALQTGDDIPLSGFVAERRGRR